MSASFESNRHELIRVLSALTPSQFEAVVLAVEPPAGVLPRSSASQEEKAVRLLEWIEGPEGLGVERFWAILDEVTQTSFPLQESSSVNWLKWGSVCLIPLAIACLVVGPTLRRSRIQAASAQIQQKGADVREAVEYVTQKCSIHQKLQGLRLPTTLLENVFGNCLSLSQYDLSNADLSNAKLNATNFFEANLRAANLTAANLSDAHLSDADLSNANLFQAYLSTAVLSSAVLREAELPQAHLFQADLSNADLGNANLFQAHLNGANLYEANLNGANLGDSFLNGASFREADLSNADLSDSFLNGADLRNASLGHANLSDVVISGAKLDGAVLAATDLRGALGLTSGQLNGANPPHLCNVALPINITNVDPNRDCAQLPQILMEKSALSLVEAQQFVGEVRQHKWQVEQ